MWFGDLVTMRWWNGIWLNEAFATFMELTTVNAYRPQWERWVSFSTERSVAMVTDGLVSTRPIEYEVVSPDDAEGMFDVLTYQKGGAVLRMLETYLGAAHFREGIRLYLDRHRYGNTETTDLWDAIEEASGEPVRAIMDSWIFQGGHPLVSVSTGERGGRPAPEAVPLRARPRPTRISSGRCRPCYAGHQANTAASSSAVDPPLSAWAASGAGSRERRRVGRVPDAVPARLSSSRCSPTSTSSTRSSASTW